MRLIMMGTGPFAVPTFLGLYDSRHAVAALATAPLRSHRGQDVPAASSLREIAREHGTPLLDAEDINAAPWPARLAEYRADLLVVCDYGQSSPRQHSRPPAWAASICTPRCCRSTAGRRRSTGPSTTARPKPASP